MFDRDRREQLVPFVGFALLIALMAFGIPLSIRSSEQRIIDKSRFNLLTIGLVFRFYANEHQGLRPRLTSHTGTLSPDPREIYPKGLNYLKHHPHYRPYLSELGTEIFVSPAHPDARRLVSRARADPVSAITDNSYWYMGYFLFNEEMGLAFVDAYRELTNSSDAPDWSEEIEASSITLRPLTEAATQAWMATYPELVDPIANYASMAYCVPVCIERPGLRKKGAHVLFLDGHVELMEYPGKFPMTEKFIQALESLDELKEAR